MLVRHNGGGLKLAVALLAICLLLAGCNSTPNPTPSISPSPTLNLALTQAGDLRTHLNLILGEQIMIVAKESVAAVNHSDDYAAYTALLTVNASDLTSLMRRAFGNTTATKLSDAWATQNNYLIDYAIGVVTHDNAKAKAAMTNLTTKFVPQFSQLLSDASHLPLDPVTQLESQQVLEDKAFIDDYLAQKFPAFYTDLHRAYQQTSRLGDALGIEVATRFADKFPGNPSIRAVSVRVTANLLLQEHSYLATMATAASLAGREGEKNVASSALSDNAAAVSALFASTTGEIPTPLVAQWTVEHDALLGYAKGDSSARATLTEKFVNDFAPLAHVGKAYVLDHVNATLKVIDDQRAKDSTAIANDDRAAATSVQPIGDSIQG
jgi:hypothetical protein